MTGVCAGVGVGVRDAVVLGSAVGLLPPCLLLVRESCKAANASIAEIF